MISFHIQISQKGQRRSGLRKNVLKLLHNAMEELNSVRRKHQHIDMLNSRVGWMNSLV